MTTTNLDDLPVSNENDSNVNIKITEQNTIVNNSVNKIQEERQNDLKQVLSTSQQPIAQQPQPSSQNDESLDINSFITGIQNAAANGGLQLPSRDIPQTQSHLTNDSQLKPNYIPDSNNDYIENSYNHNKIISDNQRNESKINSLDSLYDDIHVPIILAIIYFVFQLPIIKKNTLKYIPSLFAKDGNYNFIGYVVNSLAFASTYYVLIKSIDYLTI